MPTVPNTTLRSVDPRPLTPYFSNADGLPRDQAYARGLISLGEGVQNLSNAGANIALAENTRLAKTADVLASKMIGDWGYGEGGIYTLRGESAVNSEAGALESLEKIKKDVIATLNNPSAQALASRQIDNRIQSERERVRQYVFKEREVAQQLVSEARIDEAVQSAARSYSDPNVLSQSLAIIQNEIVTLGDRQGWNPFVTNSKLEAARTALYQQAITSAIKNDDLSRAQILFDTYKTYIDGPVAAEIANTLANQSRLKQVYDNVDRILNKNLSAEEQLSAADQIADPKLRDTVRSELYKRIVEKGTLYNLSETLNEVTRLGEVQRYSDKYISESSSYTEALTKARTITDPKLRKGVEDYIAKRYAESRTTFSFEQRKNKVENREQLLTSALDEADKITRIAPNISVALEHARDIKDPDIRIKTEQFLRSYYSGLRADQSVERAREKELEKAKGDAVKLAQLNLAYQNADRIVANTTNISDALAQAAQIQDGELREKVEKTLKSYYSNIRSDESLERARQRELAKVSESERDTQLLQQAYSTADSIIANNNSVSSALKEASSIVDANLRKEVEKQLRQFFSTTRPDVRQSEKVKKDIQEIRLSNNAQDIVDLLVEQEGSAKDALTKTSQIEDVPLRLEVEKRLRQKFTDERNVYGIERTLSRFNRLEAAKRISNIILDNNLSREAIYEQINTIDDPELAEQVRVNVDRRLKQQDSVEVENTKQVKNTAFSAIHSGQTVEEWARENPDAFNKLLEDKNALRDLYKAQEMVSDGKLFANETDGKTLSELLKLPPADLAKLDVVPIRHKLTKEEFGRLESAIKGANSAIDRLSTNYSIFNRAETILQQQADSTKFKWGAPKQSTAQRQIQDQIRNQMSEFVSGLIDDGIKPTNEMLVAKARELFTVVYTPGYEVLNLTVPFSGYEEYYVGQLSGLTPEERSEVRLPLDEVLPEAIQEAKETFIRLGRQPTDDLLEQYFGARLAGDNARINRLLNTHTLPPLDSLARRTAQLESSGNPNAQNPNSTATGLFQFTEATWLETVNRIAPDLQANLSRQEVLDLRTDPNISREVFERLVSVNSEALTSAGLPSTNENIYMAHVLGAVGATRVLKASDDTPLKDLLSPAAIQANDWLADKTVGWLKNYINKRFNG